MTHHQGCVQLRYEHAADTLHTYYDCAYEDVVTSCGWNNAYVTMMRETALAFPELHEPKP